MYFSWKLVFVAVPHNALVAPRLAMNMVPCDALAIHHVKRGCSFLYDQFPLECDEEDFDSAASGLCPSRFRDPSDNCEIN